MSKQTLRRQGTIPVLPPWKEGDKLEPSTYFSRTRPDDIAEGEAAAPVHHQEAKSAKVVGVDAQPYPPLPQGNPWRDKVDDALVRRELATAAAPNLAELSDAELHHRRAWAALTQKHAGLDTAKLEAAQGIIDAVEAEQARRTR